VICDESAFWYSENSANPDAEILTSVRPGLSTTAGPLFTISSPYARKGELWRTYQKHFGAAGDPLILVAQGTSRAFNPTLAQSVVDRAYERDPASAAAEFGAEFRRDIENWCSLEAVTACVSRDRYQSAPNYMVELAAPPRTRHCSVSLIAEKGEPCRKSQCLGQSARGRFGL
jgi:hypothetical protein